MAVKASMWPPIESTWAAITSAVRCFVPLNTMCSMKWLMPETSAPLVAAAALQPDPDGDAADVRHRLGEQGEAVGEDFPDDHGYFWAFERERG